MYRMHEECVEQALPVYIIIIWIGINYKKPDLLCVTSTFRAALGMMCVCVCNSMALYIYIELFVAWVDDMNLQKPTN